MKYNLSGLTRLEKWEDIPKPWVKVNVPKKVELGNDITSDEYKKVFAPYFPTGDNEENKFRFSSVNVTEKWVSATNAHKLIAIPNPGIKQGVGDFDITGFHSPQKGKKVDVSYPNIEVVFPLGSDFIYEVDLLKWRAYTQSMLLGEYANKTTNLISYKAKEFAYGLNGEYVLTICNTFLMLGYQKVFVGLNSATRPAIISPHIEAVEKPQENVGEKEIVLLMPMMLHDDDGDKKDYFGAREIDFNTESKVYYSFIDNEIHDADGKVASFDPDFYKDGELPYITKDYMRLLKSFISQSSAKKTIHILENVSVFKGEARVNDLESEIRISNFPVEDGIYAIVNDALKPSPYFELNDFVVRKDESEFTFAGDIKTHFLATIFSEASDFISDDDLRPALTGVIIKNEEDTTTFYATDAHVAYRRILENTPLKLNTIIVPNPELAGKALNAAYAPYQLTDVFVSDSGNLLLKANDLSYLTRLIDVRAPDIEAVIHKQFESNSIEYQQEQLVEMSGKIKEFNKTSHYIIQIPSETNKQELLDVYGTKKEKDFAIKEDGKLKDGKFIGKVDGYMTRSEISTEGKDIVLAMSLKGDPDEIGKYTFYGRLIMDKLLKLSEKGSLVLNYATSYVVQFGTIYYFLPPIEEKVKEKKKKEPKEPKAPKEKKPAKTKAAKASKEAETTEKPKYDAAFMDKMIKRLRLALKYAPDSAAIQKQIKSLETAKKYAI